MVSHHRDSSHSLTKFPAHYQPVPRGLYNCSAVELATSPVEHFPRNTPPSDAAAWVNTKVYDAAAFYLDDDPVGFLQRDNVTTDDGFTLDVTEHETGL